MPVPRPCPTRTGLALPLVLALVAGLAVLALASLTMVQGQGDHVEGSVAAHRAALAARAGFELALGRLTDLRGGLKDRFQAPSGTGRLTRSLDGADIDVVVVDLYNRYTELDRTLVVARGAADGSVRRGALHAGSVRVVRGLARPFEAVVLAEEPLDTRVFLTLVDANRDLYRADRVPALVEGLAPVGAAAYEAAVDRFVEMVRSERLVDLSFDEPTFAASMALLLDRHLSLVLLDRLARVCGALNREGTVEDVLRLAGLTDLTDEQLRGLVRDVSRRGPELTAVRTGELLRSISRTQRELLVIYVLLRRLSTLPASVRLTLGGVRRSPEETAVDLARRLYRELLSEDTDQTDLVPIFDELRRRSDRFAGRNVLQVFASLLDATTLLSWDESEGPLRTFRSVALELLRPGVPDPARLPLFGDDPILFRGEVDGSDVEAGRFGPNFTSSLPGVGISPRDYFFQRSVAALGGRGGGPDGAEGPDPVHRRVRLFIDEALDSRGVQGLNDAAALAAAVGLSDTQARDLADLLHASACDHHIWYEELTLTPRDPTAPSSALGGFGEAVRDVPPAGTPLPPGDIAAEPIPPEGTQGGLGGPDSPGTDPQNPLPPAGDEPPPTGIGVGEGLPDGPVVGPLPLPPPPILPTPAPVTVPPTTSTPLIGGVTTDDLLGGVTTPATPAPEGGFIPRAYRCLECDNDWMGGPTLPRCPICGGPIEVWEP